MKVVLPGGSGQVGTILARWFHGRGDEVVVLSRNPQGADWRTVHWDAQSPGPWVTELDAADVVINLAGRSVNCRYTPDNRESIGGSMEITDCSFTNSDTEYNLIKELLLEVETYPELDNNWDPGRMDWWRYNVHAEKGADFFQANAHYWKTDTDQVVGLFVSEYGRDDFFIVVHPNFWTLFSDVLIWGLDVWARGKTKICTSVYTYGQQKIEQLMAAGFDEDGHEANVRTYTLRDYDFSYDLKPEFNLLRFSDYGNYESRVKLVHNAFDNLSYSEARLRSLQSSPTYQAELDLVIVNSQGESVAYCMGWVEENDPTAGYIEPIGVHSAYRRNGLGTALAKECFKRLAKLGVERATIASHAEPDVSNFLYDSLNPTSVKRAHRYSLNLEK